MTVKRPARPVLPYNKSRTPFSITSQLLFIYDNVSLFLENLKTRSAPTSSHGKYESHLSR